MACVYPVQLSLAGNILLGKVPYVSPVADVLTGSEDDSGQAEVEARRLGDGQRMQMHLVSAGLDAKYGP